VTLRSRDKGVGALETRALEHFLVRTVAEDRCSAELRTKSTERRRRHVHDRHFVPGVGQHQRQSRTDTATPHDDDERIRPPGGRELAAALAAHRACRTSRGSYARRGARQPYATGRVLENV